MLFFLCYHHWETVFMNKPVFLRLIPIVFLALASIMPAPAQTQRTVEVLYTEVIGYVDTRTNEFTAKGKRPSRDDQESFQKEQSQLAAKYAAKIAAYPNLSSQDLAYLGLLYDMAEDDEKGLETYRRFLGQLSPDAAGNAVQIARSRIVVYAGRKKLLDEMEKAYEAWLKGSPVQPTLRPSLEGSMAVAYFKDKNYEQAIKYGRSSLETIKNLEAKTWQERSQKTDMYATLVETLLRSYQKSDRKEEAISILAEGRALAFTIPSAKLYQKIMYMVDEYGVSEKKLMEKVESFPAAYPAPEFAVKEWLGQEPVTLESLRGKVVLLDFWATWCPPCIKTFPRLRGWHKKYGPQGFTIVGVTKFYGQAGTRKVGQPDELSFLREFRDDHKLPYGFAVAEGDDTASKYGVLVLPSTFLLDRHGVVRYIGMGAKLEEAENLEEMIKKVLAEQ